MVAVLRYQKSQLEEGLMEGDWKSVGVMVHDPSGLVHQLGIWRQGSLVLLPSVESQFVTQFLMVNK